MTGRHGRRLEEVTGRRVETVEWGYKQLWGDVAGGSKAAHTESCGADEKHARGVVYNPDRRHYIMPPLVLVRRTVVTYTTTWEIVPGEAPPVQTNMRPQDGWTWERALSVVPPALGDPGPIPSPASSPSADDPQSGAVLMAAKRAHEVIGGDGRVRVLAPQCRTCIYGPGSIVSPARRDEVTAANLTADALLTCHHTLPGNPDRIDPAVCAGFWARHRRDVLAGRLAHLIGITRIQPPGKGTRS